MPISHASLSIKIYIGTVFNGLYRFGEQCHARDSPSSCILSRRRARYQIQQSFLHGRIYHRLKDLTFCWHPGCYTRLESVVLPEYGEGHGNVGGLGESDYRQGYENPLQFQLDKRELQ